MQKGIPVSHGEFQILARAHRTLGSLPSIDTHRTFGSPGERTKGGADISRRSDKLRFIVLF